MIKHLWYKWVNRDRRSSHERFEDELKAKRLKVTARTYWSISLASSDSEYVCSSAGDICSFTPEVIANCKQFVKRQEQSNPNWEQWIQEWKNDDSPY